MFRFTISDLGIFLGKAPATIRGWERKGFMVLPRVGINRSLAIDDVREVAKWASQGERISKDRYTLIMDALGALSVIEQENT